MKKITLEGFEEIIKNKDVYGIIEIIKRRKKSILSFDYKIGFDGEYGGLYSLNMSISEKKFEYFEHFSGGIETIDLCYQKIAKVLFLRDALLDYKISHVKN